MQTYQVYDLLSDILSQGQSSRLYNRLFKEHNILAISMLISQAV